MPQALLKVELLPEDSVKAAASFYGDYLHAIEAMLSQEAGALAICLPGASKSHDHWRRAAARDLARVHAPKRINIVGGSDEVAIRAILSYLENAPGITGQYLAAHD